MAHFLLNEVADRLIFNPKEHTQVTKQTKKNLESVLQMGTSEVENLI